MSEPIFLPSSIFFLRVPRLPRKSADHLLAQDDWQKAIWDFYEKNPLLQEAVLVASPSLFYAIEKGSRTEAVAASLLKYALRMGTRSTPYGLFSFIATGRWEGEDSQLDLAKVEKRARPDLGWVFLFLQKLYADEKLFSTLSVQTNALIKTNQERCSLSFVLYAEKEDERTDFTFSIRNGALIETIFKLAAYPKTVNALCEELLERMPNLNRAKLVRLLHQLVEKQFLLPGILPSLFSLAPFDELRSRIKGLEWVEPSIKAYEKLPLGAGVAMLQALEKQFLDKIPAKNGLQIDTVYQGAPAVLPEEIANTLSEAATMLWTLSPRKSTGSAIAIYHEKFLEKYGTDRTVSLLELLSEEKGLGSFRLEEGSQRGSIPFKLHWEKWLHMQWEECLRSGRKEIELPEDLGFHLYNLCGEKPTNPLDAQVSIDLFCKISATSKEQIDAGNFLVEIVQPSWHGGSAVGRFLYLLKEEERNAMQSYFSSEEALEEGTLFVEMSGHPKTGYNANVASYPCLRKYRLDLQGKKCEEGVLRLKDIYVGSNGNRLYLTRKEGGSEIVFRVCNFVNANLTAAPLQFMREVSLTRFQLFHPFSWGPLERNASFLPRVRYKKAVLSVAQWNLGPSIFDKKKDLVEQFNDWAEKWALPQKSLCGHLDQYLLIDRHHPASLREIVLKIKKGEPLQFIEELPQTWLQSDEGSHAVELVFPMLKNPVYATKTQFSAPAYSEIAFRDRVKLLGEEWVYLKIYLDPAEADRFLIEQITPLLQDKKLFFIRYRDNGFHLRLRIEMTPFLIEELTDKVAYWMEAGLIHNVLWAPYEREIERYGGLELIGQAEMLFCEDSDDVLQELFSEQDVTSRAISGCRFLKGFGFDRSQMISLLQGNLRSLQALSGFRKHKSQLMTSMTEMLAEEGSSDAKRAFREKGTGLSEEKVFGIYNSLLHMHYNRLGCNRSEEEKARLYALHTLVQIEKRMPRDNICHEASISQCP